MVGRLPELRADGSTVNVRPVARPGAVQLGKKSLADFAQACVVWQKARTTREYRRIRIGFSFGLAPMVPGF